MDNKAIGLGVGGALVGLLVGAALGGAVNTGKMETAINRTLVPAQEEGRGTSEALQAQLAQIEERMAALETAVTGNAVDPEALSASFGQQTEGLSAQISTQIAEEISSQMSGLQSALGDKIAQSGEAQAAAIEAALQKVSVDITDSAQIAASAVAAAEGGSAAVLSDTAEISGALGVGETAIFAEGALRVFISRLDRETGSARVSVNGALQSLGTGGSTQVSAGEQDCTLAIMGLTSEGVTLGADCGAAQADAEDSAPEMDEDSAAAETGAESEAAPLENAIRPGNTLRLADGALRVFIVSVDSEGQGARVAPNGVLQTRLSVGESTEVAAGEQTCTLTLDGVQDGAASLSAACQ